MVVTDVAEHRNKQFHSVFERIRGDVLTHTPSAMPIEAVQWIRRNLDLQVLDGSNPNNAMSVEDAMVILWGRTLSDDERFKATLLEWCIKISQASRPHVYSNDKISGHRKNLHWHPGDDAAAGGSLWLCTVTYHLLKKHFRAETYYTHLLELFQDTTFQTDMGQMVNFTTVSKDHVDLGKFTLQKYSFITRSKFTSFYLPIAVAMSVCGVPESYTVQGCFFSPYATARSISLHLSEYFQTQEDFLDSLDTVGKGGKMGSDVMENKCSWCINTALVVSSPEEREALEENYGQDDPEKERRVRQIYETIGLREQYQIYEANMKERIEGLIMEISGPEGNVDSSNCVLKREVFSRFLEKIYERTESVSSEYSRTLGDDGL